MIRIPLYDGERRFASAQRRLAQIALLILLVGLWLLDFILSAPG